MVRALKRLVSYRRPVIIVIHGFLVAVAYLLAFLLRFEFDFASLPWKLVVSTFPLLIAIRTPDDTEGDDGELPPLRG